MADLHIDGIPVHPRYDLETHRSDSFLSYPFQLTNDGQLVEQLVSSGFFYGGKGDHVICFYCGYGLKNLDPACVVLLEHFKLNPQCELVQLQVETAAALDPQLFNYEAATTALTGEEILASLGTDLDDGTVFHSIQQRQ